MDYAKAAVIFATAKNPEAGKPLQNNTRLMKRGDDYAVRLHNTDIITFKANGDIVLDSGGWKTVTTRDRMNEYTNAHVSQLQGVWRMREALYADGVVIDADGMVKRYSGAKPLPVDAHKKLMKQTGEYGKRFINALVAGKVGAPGLGDCWFCVLRDKAGKPMGELTHNADHIHSHMADSYFVPALLVNAMKAFGTSPAAEQTAHAFMQGKLEYAFAKKREDFLFTQLATVVRRYVRREVGLPPN